MSPYLQLLKRPEVISFLVATIITGLAQSGLVAAAGLPLPETEIGMVVSLVWAVFVGSVTAGPLLLASQAYATGIPLTVTGIGLAVLVPRRLHRLSRRWLVIVPAGIVVHDHMVLAETMMVRRSQTRELAVRADNGEAADLTGGVIGVRVVVALTQADKVILTPITMRTLGTSEALHVQMFSVAPRRVAAAHAALVNERS